MAEERAEWLCKASDSRLRQSLAFELLLWTFSSLLLISAYRLDQKRSGTAATTVAMMVRRRSRGTREGLGTRIAEGQVNVFLAQDGESDSV